MIVWCPALRAHNNLQESNKMNNVSAILIKEVNENQKLWQCPNGMYVLTSFSTILNHNETMAFKAWENGGVKDWLDLACIVDSHPRHEEVINIVANKEGSSWS
jgi:hypothetical protein|tara:strand:- start:33 stop:341 length:309 start_codon:yes stop_codon:yes gene_type:complete